MANKIATVLVLDLFPLNERKCALENISGLESMVHWCRDFIIQKQIFSPFDEIGMVLCGSQEEEKMSEPSVVDACYNLQTPQVDVLAAISMLEARVQAVKNTQPAHQSSSISACSTLLKGLEAAVKVLLANKKTYAGKQIIALLPDKGKATRAHKELIIGLLEKLSQQGISLLVLGLDDDDDDEGVTYEGKQQEENTAVFRTLCEELTRRAEVKAKEEEGDSGKHGSPTSKKPSPAFSVSAIMGWEEAEKAVNALRPRKGMVRPLCKVVWTIGGSCKIATQLYTRTSVQTIPTLKKVVRRAHASCSAGAERIGIPVTMETIGKGNRKRERESQEIVAGKEQKAESDEDEWEEVVAKTEYYSVESFVNGSETTANDPSPSSTSIAAPTVPVDQLLTAYRYGSTWIPCSDADLFAMKMHEPVRSLRTLGFVPQEQVAPFISAGGSGAKALLPLADDEMGQRGFRALTLAMEAEKTVAIVRYVRTANQNPKLALLSIPLETAFQEEGGARFLVMTSLPFQEDVRLFQFPSYGIKEARDVSASLSSSSNSVATENLLAQLVDSMTVSSRSSTTDGDSLSLAWSSFPASPSLYNPTWQHFYHVVHFKLEDGALRKALSFLRNNRQDGHHEESNAVAQSMLRMIQQCDSLQEAQWKGSGSSDSVAIMEDAVTQLLQSRPSAEKVAIELDERVASTSTGFHQLPNKAAHELLPLFLKASPMMEALANAFPLLSFTAAQEEAIAAESVAAVRRHRHEMVNGNQGGVLPTSWFSLGGTTNPPTKESEQDTPADGSSRCVPPIHVEEEPSTESPLSPVIQKVSTIDPAGTFEALMKNLLAKGEGNTDERRLFSIFMELENVIRELFRHSFPDTHYLKIQDAVLALRRFCCRADLQFKSTGSEDENSGAVAASSCCDYYNDYLKKLLLWCRAEGHGNWFTEVGLLSVDAAKGESSPLKSNHVEEWITVSLALAKVKGNIGPITATECVNSVLSDDRAGLLFLLESHAMAETLPGENEEDDLMNADGQDDVDDWIE